MVKSLTTGSSDSQHTKAAVEAQKSWKISEKDGISIVAAPSRGTRHIAIDISQGRKKVNDSFSRPLWDTPNLLPYVETGSSEPHNGFLETAGRGDLFTRESERLESAISSKYPCARLSYVSVGSNTKLRLYNTTGQHLVKDPPGPDNVYKNLSWIASDGLTNPADNEWFMLKGLTGTNSQKPLQLSCHRMASSAEPSSLEKDMRKNYEDVSRFLTTPHSLICAYSRSNRQTFDASYDYPPGLDRCKLVAPVYFARLVSLSSSKSIPLPQALTLISPVPQATKRALLLMDRKDHASDTAPFKLRPVHPALRDTSYYI